MRYLPLSPDDRSEMLAKIGVDAIRPPPPPRSVRRCPAGQAPDRTAGNLPRRKGEMGGRAQFWAEWPDAT